MRLNTRIKKIEEALEASHGRNARVEAFAKKYLALISSIPRGLPQDENERLRAFGWDEKFQKLKEQYPEESKTFFDQLHYDMLEQRRAVE